MNYKLVLVIAVLLISGCKSTSELEPLSSINPGISQEGSLANGKLIADATAGLENIIGSTINNPDSNFLKFVIQQPVGDVGARSWREMWVIKNKENDNQFILTFKEVGIGAADFEIQKMSKSVANENCPTSMDEFKQGVSNLFIKNCLGEPDYLDQNPDGRYVYLYNRANGISVTYLFNSENQLIRHSIYLKKSKT